MQRAFGWLLWILVALVALPAVLLAAALIAANTGPGRSFIVRAVGALSGGMVTVSGLGGTVPQSIRIRRIEIADRQGVWCVVDDAALDWSPLALLSGRARVDRVTAVRVAVRRQPASAGVSSGKPFRLPLPVDLDHAHVGRLELAAPLLGSPAALTLDASAHLEALFQGRAELVAADLDAAGNYFLRADVQPAGVAVTLRAREAAAGLAARIGRLPANVGALAVQASVVGPRRRAATTLTLAAGAVHADVQGAVDLNARTADLTLAARAPAMTPAPGLSFASAALTGRVHGTLQTPQGELDLHVQGIAAADAAIRDLAATIAFTSSHAALSAEARGARIPGPKHDLLADTPVRLSADLALRQQGRPATFLLSHPLLTLKGTARTADPPSFQAHLDVADLAPLAAIAGVDVQGRTALDIAGSQAGDTTELTLGGTLGLSGGQAPLPALIGPDARLALAATRRGTAFSVSRVTLDGAAITLLARGGVDGGGLDATADATLPNLRAAAPTISGAATLHAHVAGNFDDLAVQATVAGDMATRGTPKGHVEATLNATGLPGAPSGSLRAAGQLDGSPLAIEATVARAAGGAIEAALTRADWKGAHADARLALAPGARLPTGTAALRVRSLADFRRLSGLALTGGVEARLAIADAGGRPVVTANIRARQAGLPGQAAIQLLALDARVGDPLGDLSVDATMAAEGVRAGAIAGNARARIRGPRTALAIRADASATGVAGGPARLSTRATLDLPARTVALAALDAEARGASVRLLAPARISLGGGIAVNRLRLGLGQAVLDVAGRVSPTLDLTASLRNATADLARVADPSLDAQGTLSAQARLTGTMARPSGTILLAARGLHVRQGIAAGLPPVDITADAALAGRTARVNAGLVAGSTRLAVSGTAPISPAAAINLRATGGLDLALTDPMLTPSGRRARGTLALDATVTGTVAAPRASGSATLTGGWFEDFGQGIRLSHVDALIEAQGDHVTLTRLTGRAGSGTLRASGSVGLAAPRPVDMRLLLDHAEPIASDLITAMLNADLAVRGALAGGLAASGRIALQRANITVPDQLPSSVAVLDVRVPGRKPPPPPAPPPPIGLDVTLNAPGVIFVRGHGLNAVLRGDLHAGGTAAHPQVTGGFTMVNGTFSFAGTNLTFTTGTVTFDGSGKLDPVLDFVASSTSGSVTANLEVTGYASNPKILLSSSPPLPQDEVLAHLLFGQSASSLSPFQLGEIALALAQLTGGPGAGIDPLGAARKALGLDRLQVIGGSGASSSGATLQAGQYVAPGVYVGAAQGTGGGSTQAQVQIDITRGLKLNTTVGTGGGSATGSSQSSDSGTSIGLTYQFQY